MSSQFWVCLELSDLFRSGESKKLMMRYRNSNLQALLDTSAKAAGNDEISCMWSFLQNFSAKHHDTGVKLLKCVEGQFNKAFLLAMNNRPGDNGSIAKSKCGTSFLHNCIRSCDMSLCMLKPFTTVSKEELMEYKVARQNGHTYPSHL